MKLRILVLTRDRALHRRLRRLLDDADAVVRMPSVQQACWSMVRDTPCDVVMAGGAVLPEPAEETVATLAAQPNAPAIVVFWPDDDVDVLAALRAAGAEAALAASVPTDVLGQAVATILQRRRDDVARTVAARRSTSRPALQDFVSTSPAIQRFLKTVYRVVDSDAPLLITGETGVGKERLARAIHYESRRCDGPFLSVNCGAIPENLLESQLFGHEKGAFTGATRAQRGCFELAHQGTLFLDEISEMPFHLQVKFLHVLQDFTVRPVGGEQTIDVDVRVVAATNRDIDEEIRARRFREDLYYRLSVVSIRVPPLRERVSDIPALATSIVEDLGKRIGFRVAGIDSEAMEALTTYAWPGNVRELINVLERAMLLCELDHITLDDLPEDISGTSRAAAGEARTPTDPDWLPDDWPERPLKEVREQAVERIERAYLAKLLALTGGRVGDTARRAGLEPRSLFNKMQRYGLRKEDFRPARDSR